MKKVSLGNTGLMVSKSPIRELIQENYAFYKREVGQGA